MLFAILLLAVPQSQRLPEPFASHPVSVPRIAISPNGAFAAIVSNATAIRMDPRTQKAEALAEGGQVGAVALGDDSYTLGLHDGRIVHVDAQGRRREFAAGKRRAILGLQRHEDLVAWWDAESRANVLDLRSGAGHFETPLEVWAHSQAPALCFAADGKCLCLWENTDRAGIASYVRVVDLGDGAEIARLPCFTSHADAFVLAGSNVVHANRVEAGKWNLLAFDLLTRESRVLDADLRGGHFVDLWASPSGRYVLEGDFEEHGLARYDLAGKDAARVEFGEYFQALGCGWLQLGSERVEVVFGTSRRDPSAFEAWRLDDCKRIDRSFPHTAAPGIECAGTFADGLGLWCSKWLGPGSERARCMEFFSLDPDAKKR